MAAFDASKYDMTKLNEDQKRILAAYAEAINPMTPWGEATAAKGEPQGLRDPNVVPDRYTASAARMDPAMMESTYAAEFETKANTINPPAYLTPRQKNAYRQMWFKMSTEEGMRLFAVGGAPMIRSVLLTRMDRHLRRQRFKKWFLDLTRVLFWWRKKK